MFYIPTYTLLVCGSGIQFWLFQKSLRMSTKVQMQPKAAQCVSQKSKHVWLVCIMNEKAVHYQIWLCRHWALGTGYWVGGSGVVKLSFYRSNPGERTTVPDRIPQVYIHKFPTRSTGNSLYEYRVKHCSRFHSNTSQRAHSAN